MSALDVEQCAGVVMPNIADRRCTSSINTVAAEAMGSVLNAMYETQDKTLCERTLVGMSTELLSGLAHETVSSLAADELDRRRAYSEAFERVMRICHMSNGKLVPPKAMIPAMLQVLAAAMASSLVRRSQTTQGMLILLFFFKCNEI